MYVHACFKGITIYFSLSLCTWRGHVRLGVNCPENPHVFPPLRAGGARVLVDRYEHFRLKILKAEEEAAAGRMLLCKVRQEYIEAAFLSSCLGRQTSHPASVFLL